MQKTCPICGITFHTRHTETKTCSRKCGGILHRTNSDLTCEYCKKVFRRTADGHKHGARFCSRACYDAYRTESRPLCVHCGSRVKAGYIKQAKNHFCSTECRSAFYQPKHKPCINCGRVFTAIKFRFGKWASTNSGKTCSAKCHNEWIRNNPERKRKISDAFTGAKHPNWQGGKSAINLRVHRGSGWERLAEKARDRDGRVCMLCGKTEADNGRKMDVHHIVTYHDINNAKKANRLSNLISLCKSCHKKEEHKIQHQQIVLPFAAIAQADRRAARASAQS